MEREPSFTEVRLQVYPVILEIHVDKSLRSSSFLQWPPFSLAPSVFSPPLPQGPLSPWGRAFMATAHSGPSDLMAIALCSLSNYKQYICSIVLLQEERPLIMSQSLIYEYRRMSLGVILLHFFSRTFLISRTIAFELLLGPRPVQSVSSSWPPKKCQGQLPSHGVDIK